MKRLVALMSLAGMTCVAHAQSYAGAVAALTKIGYECDPAAISCDHKDRGFKAYAGVLLDADSRINLGVGSLDAVEVGYLKFGQVRQVGVADQDYLDSNNAVQTRSVSNNKDIEINALTFAAVAHFPIVAGLSASARLGVAYASSSVATIYNGSSNGRQTSTKFKPYVGVGLDYDIPGVIKLVTSYDRTQFDVQGAGKGGATLVGFGAEKSF